MSEAMLNMRARLPIPQQDLSWKREDSVQMKREPLYKEI